MIKECDVLIIGSGPAGLSAAFSSKDNGAKEVIVLERNEEAGGILNQCIHSGFGLQYFKEELTGPEYAQRLLNKAEEIGVKILTNITAVNIENVSDKEKIVYCICSSGLVEIHAGSVIVATGCRERTRGAIAIPGDRPSGIFTAGTAQRYINIEGWMVGKRVVILGSGDIGLIMARRLTLEGAEVLGCIEICPYSNGLNRNIVQCLDDFNIPLYLSHTITKVVGKKRLEKVVVQKVDCDRKPIPGTEFEISCDTLLLSVGLIPENEIAISSGVELDPKTKGPIVFENMETTVPGLFSTGNSLHVNDLADFVTLESIKAGRNAALYTQNKEHKFEKYVEVKPLENISYIVPQRLHLPCDENVEFSFRVNKEIKKAVLEVWDGDNLLHSEHKNYLSPGRMEHCKLDKDKLRVNNDLSFIIKAI